MTSPFAQPSAGGDKFDLKNNGHRWLGSLLLIYPKEVKADFDSGQFEPTDVVVADIIFVDGPDAGQLFKSTFLFAKFIVGTLKGNVGGTVLGRLGQKQGRQGMGWSIEDHSDLDVGLATPVDQKYRAGTFQQPTAMTQDPWTAAGYAGGPTGVATPPATATPTAPPTATDHTIARDPTIALLLSKGIDVQKLLEMTPETRAMLASAYQ